jgi:hypothetical protein
MILQLLLGIVFSCSSKKTSPLSSCNQLHSLYLEVYFMHQSPQQQYLDKILGISGLSQSVILFFFPHSLFSDVHLIQNCFFHDINIKLNYNCSNPSPNPCHKVYNRYYNEYFVQRIFRTDNRGAKTYLKSVESRSSASYRRMEEAVRGRPSQLVSLLPPPCGPTPHGALAP